MQQQQLQRKYNVWSKWDRAVSLQAYNQIGTQLPRWWLLLFEHGGNGLFWIPGAVAAWLAPQLSAAQRTCVANLLLGFVMDLVLVGALKGLVRRQRPVYNQGGDFLLVVSVDKFSFPSGHSSRAMFIASFACVYWQCGERWLSAAVLVWGLLTSVSRALMGRHYVGDVLAGVALGVFITSLITQREFTLADAIIDEPLSESAHAVVWQRLRSLGQSL